VEAKGSSGASREKDEEEKKTNLRDAKQSVGKLPKIQRKQRGWNVQNWDRKENINNFLKYKFKKQLLFIFII